MTIEQRTSGGVSILDVRGKMTIEALRDMAIADTARSLVQAGRKQILLNLGGVPYLDTMGLCNIVEAYITTQKHGGAVKLTGLQPHARHLLLITRLLTVFEVYESEEEAIASFGSAMPS